MPTPALVLKGAPPARQEHLSLGRVVRYISNALFLTMSRTGSRLTIVLRSREFEYVGLEDHKDGHHDRQADRPLQDQAQEVSLLALEARGARSDGKVLRRDHLPQNATRGVGADGQVGAQP